MTNPTSLDRIDPSRRKLLRAAALSLMAAPAFTSTDVFADVASDASASANASSTRLPPSRQVRAGLLDVGYVEWGPADGPPVLLLHGWPYDIHAFVDVGPLLATKGYRAIAPSVRGYGSTRIVATDTPRSGQPAALALDTVAFMDALRIRRAIVAGFDWGGRTADILAAVWPERCKALVSVSGYLLIDRATGAQPLAPEAELSWWYQFYFATERGRAGYDANRHAFNKLIWRLASPRWTFDDATYDRSARSFDNPDHVAIVVHNYRWRQGLVDGDPLYDDLERRLATLPVVTVPTITLEGDANGAPHPAASAYATKFTGRYLHREVGGGIGHNLPQEAPQAFAQAIVDVDAFGS